MRRVILESPYAAGSEPEVERNVDYAKCCLFDCLQRGESPIASHILLAHNRVLSDAEPQERLLGMAAGHAWIAAAEAVVVYHDRGISSGMREGIATAVRAGVPVEYRKLGSSWEVQQ